MRAFPAILFLAVLLACGGDGGGAVEPPPPQAVPSAAELVPEPIPFDELGSHTVHFSRYLGGFYTGLVRLNGADRSVSVFADPLFGTTVTRSGQHIAFWCFLCPNGYAGDNGDAVMVRRIDAQDATATRVSGSARVSRSRPGWDPVGQVLYWLEGDPGSRFTLVRRPVLPGAGQEAIVVEIPRPCQGARGPAPAVSAAGDVAFSVVQQAPQGTSCTKVLLRWNSTTGVIDTLAFVGGALAWSPDGSRLALLRDFGSALLYVINADGSGSSPIYEASRGSGSVTGLDEAACWSGADRILFSYNSGGFTSRIWSVRPDGSAAIALTSPAPKSAAGVAWDGNVSCTS